MSNRKPCEICGETDCEDSSIEYYIECWKEAEAALKEKDKEIKRLRRALLDIVKHPTPYNFVLDIAKAALEARDEERD